MRATQHVEPWHGLLTFLSKLRSGCHFKASLRYLQVGSKHVRAKGGRCRVITCIARVKIGCGTWQRRFAALPLRPATATRATSYHTTGDKDSAKFRLLIALIALGAYQWRWSVIM